MEKDRESRHEELQKELIAELKSLRGAVRETAEGFILCKEGEIETLLDYLLKMPPGRLKAVVRPWLRDARDMKLKPAKGRVKDLKRIDNLLHDLLNHVIDADDEEQKSPPPAKKASRAVKGEKGAAPELQAV